MRIVICGPPNSGKTTLANRLGLPTLHMDDLINAAEWSEAAAIAARWANKEGPWVIEGVRAPWALRAILEARPGMPCDVIIWLTEQHVPLTDGQRSITESALSVWSSIEAEINARAVPFAFGGAKWATEWLTEEFGLEVPDA